MMRSLLPWFALCLLAAPRPASAQVIQGRALDAASGNPVQDVSVRIESDGKQFGTTVTDSAGRFTLRAASGGTYRLTTSHIAFAPVAADVEVGSGSMVEVVLRLSVAPTELPAIEVVARGRAPDAGLERAGFYDRRNAGFGVFRTPDDIERRRIFAPSDLFLSTNGIRVEYAGIQGKDVRMTRGADTDCRPRVFIDNVMARRGGRNSMPGDPPLDALVAAGDILAVEIYRSPSETPQQYAGNDVTCGVIIFWTKRGSGRD
jgi:Carboxypeptidase regulatory-like domain